MVASVEGVVVENLTVMYGGIVAVDSASFTAPPGAVTAVLGPNGAGKTSTIEVCEGYRRAQGGTVTVLGLDPVRDHRALTTVMGVMLQDGGIYPSARVGETIALYCDLHGSGIDPVALAATVGLGHRLTSSWRRLSGGERQRLSLALALAAKPRVAFLDEPTSGVDIDGRARIREIVRGLADGGTTVVLATHELDEAEHVADNIVVFSAGRVVASGPLADLRAGHHRVMFRSRPGLDVAAMSDRLGAGVSAGDDGWYVIAAPHDAHLVAAAGTWLAERGEPLHELRAGEESLAELYRRVTDGAQQ